MAVKNCVSLVVAVISQLGNTPVTSPSQRIAPKNGFIALMSYGARIGETSSDGTVSGTTSIFTRYQSDGAPHPSVLTLKVTVPENNWSQLMVTF